MIAAQKFCFCTHEIVRLIFKLLTTSTIPQAGFDPPGEETKTCTIFGGFGPRRDLNRGTPDLSSLMLRDCCSKILFLYT